MLFYFFKVIKKYLAKYESNLDDEWNEEFSTIQLYHGDSSDGVASHRSGFIKDDGDFATNFRYKDMISYYHLSDFLFKKYQGQLKTPRMILTA